VTDREVINKGSLYLRLLYLPVSSSSSSSCTYFFLLYFSVVCLTGHVISPGYGAQVKPLIYTSKAPIFKAYKCIRPWDLVLTVPLKTICPHAAGLMTPVGSYLHTSYIIISHSTVHFMCLTVHVISLGHVNNVLLKSIRHRLICHYSFVLSLLFSHVLIVSG